MKNILFYKFIEIKEINIIEEKNKINLFLNQNNIKGKIILATEGINGCLTGQDLEIIKTQKFLEEKFGSIFFKKENIKNHGFKRTVVIIKDEIITFSQQPQTIAAQNLKPKDLKAWYENQDDFLIFDTRNDYEYNLGHFKNAINIKTSEFTEFPKKITEYKEQIKNKKSVFYCTGGIRCEKATNYLINIGIDKKNIYQLDGGIINYGQKIGSKFWDGLCFVFDNRGAIEIDPKKQNLDITQCSICFVPNTQKNICLYCQKANYNCSECLNITEKCCSKNCRNDLRYKKTGQHKKLLKKI